ncbi:MAG: glycosyltransferase [Steroidobacteraceae bacterium]
MNEPAVTVFIPAFNRAAYIGTAIQSVLRQGFKDFELLVVDDGSTDRTVEIVKTFDDRRVRLVCNDRNRGIPYTRNRGLDLAAGASIALMDSDDYMMPNRLARQVRFLQSHPEVALVGGWLRRFDNAGNIRGFQTKPLVHDQLRVTLLFRTSHANTTLMGRTAVLREFRYSEAYPLAEDHDLFVRLSRVHRVANIPCVLSGQREHSGRITKAAGERLLENKFRLLGALLRELGVAADPTDVARHYRLTRVSEAELRSDPGYLDWAADWLRRLVEANERTGVYDRRALSSIAAIVWVETCARAIAHVGVGRVWPHARAFPWLRGVAAFAAGNLAAATGIRR